MGKYDTERWKVVFQKENYVEKPLLYFLNRKIVNLIYVNSFYKNKKNFKMVICGASIKKNTSCGNREQ